MQNGGGGAGWDGYYAESMAAHNVVPDDYAAAPEELKGHVRKMLFQAQPRVNASVIELYWSIGKTILMH